MHKIVDNNQEVKNKTEASKDSDWVNIPTDDPQAALRFCQVLANSLCLFLPHFAAHRGYPNPHSMLLLVDKTLLWLLNR